MGREVKESGRRRWNKEVGKRREEGEGKGGKERGKRRMERATVRTIMIEGRKESV